MKIILVLVLLANIVFFLWEYSSNHTVSEYTRRENVEKNKKSKQILLMSEATITSEIEPIVLATNDFTILAPASAPVSAMPPIIKSTVKKTSIQKSNLNKPLSNGVNTGRLVKKNKKELDNTEVEKKVVKSILNSNRKIEKTEDHPLKNRKDNAEDKYSIQQIVKSCYQIGPFEDDFAIEQWRQLNSISIQSLRPFNKNASNKGSFLVYYPAELGSTKESKKKFQIFEKLGIKNVSAFKIGKLKDAISLGIFDRQEPANLLQENLARYNVKVEILPNYIDPKILFVNVLSYQPDFRKTVILSNLQTVSSCEKR